MTSLTAASTLGTQRTRTVCEENDCVLRNVQLFSRILSTGDGAKNAEQKIDGLQKNKTLYVLQISVRVIKTVIGITYRVVMLMLKTRTVHLMHFVSSKEGYNVKTTFCLSLCRLIRRWLQLRFDFDSTPFDWDSIPRRTIVESHAIRMAIESKWNHTVTTALMSPFHNKDYIITECQSHCESSSHVIQHSHLCN